MVTGLRQHGKAIGVEPKAPYEVYADREAIGAWEEVVLTASHDGLVDVRFLAANRQLTVTPNGKLESRPAGEIGEWELFTRTGQVLSRAGYQLDIDGPPPIAVLSRLHLQGLDFVTEAGARHIIAGSTELLLGWRYDREGPDAIAPVLAERQALGFNNLRVLWQKDIGNTGHSAWQMPVEKLKPFHELAAAHGFYIEGTILADCQVLNPSTAAQQTRVNDVRVATVGIANVVEQLGNEYDKNGHDPRLFTKPSDRLAANSSSTEGGKDAPYWDFFCFSGQRSPLNHAIREYGPLEFMYNDGKPWGGVPAICDEGMKPGVNSSDPRDFERAGAQARSGCGGRFHSVAGTGGNSRLFDDLEKRCAAAFIKGLGV